MRNLTSLFLLFSSLTLLSSRCSEDEENYCNIFSIVNNSEDTILFTYDLDSNKKVDELINNYNWYLELPPYKSYQSCPCYSINLYSEFYYFIKKSKVDDMNGKDFSTLQWDTIMEVKRYEMQLPGYQIIYSKK